MHYSYHTLALRDGASRAAAAFADEVRGPIATRVRDAGGDLLGCFLPQLGFASHERALLIRWRGEPGDGAATSPLVGSCTVDRLAATARPGEADRPRPGGVYVHRWFVISAADRDEFVELSKAAWVDFEGDFDSEIFGLFAAEPQVSDGASMRMLLLTRYGTHADWEASRRPSAASAANFARRRELTKFTRGCSTTLA